MNKRSSLRLARPQVQLRAFAVAMGLALALLVAQGIGIAFAVNRVAQLAPDQAALILEELPSILSGTALMAFVLMVPSVLAVVLGATHRFVGPLDRMQRFLRDHLAGERVGTLRLREKDVLKDLASLIEEVVQENQAHRDRSSEREAA